jgi:glyoxylase-like metal-dependent hydrolase (beta-lactamase superfamily II)
LWPLRFVCVFLASIALAVAAPLKPVRVAEHVYAFIGDSGDVSVANRGRIGNSGFIVAPEGIIVIDTGVSYRYAQDMAQAIKRISKRPIRLAIITHAHQEFLMGASYFQRQGVPILTHVKTAQLMRSRCENCLHHLKETLGATEMRGSKVVVPDQQIDASEFISVAGISLELHVLGWGNTAGDIAIFHREAGVLFAGGLVDDGRVPELRDSKLKDWQAVLAKLQKFPIKHLVPGHGALGGINTIAAFAAYLSAIERKARALFEANVSLSDAEKNGDLPEFKDWTLYQEQHHKNVHRAYLQIEQEDLEK